MAHVKTAVSLDKDLFEEVEAMADEMNITRSCLVVLALRDFLRRYQSQRLLEQIDSAYSDAPDPSDHALQSSMIRQHRQVVEGEW